MDKKLLEYWKNCLLDAERKNISPKEVRITLRIGDKTPEYILQKDIPTLFPKSKENKKDEKQKIQIAPCVILPEYENGWASKQGKPEYPFLISAMMLPDGTLQVCDNKADRIPIFVRKFLEPNALNDQTIASLSKVDRLLSEFDTEISDWKIYWQSCEKLFLRVTGQTFLEMNYSEMPEIVITKAAERGMAFQIINLYEKLLNDNKPHKLLNLITRKQAEKSLPLPKNQDVYCNANHLAQMSGDFPLSVSQRETLAMFTSPDCSDIFAVNGPPGTGKTTFLQTVIANRLVQNVLDNPSDPEIIIASSANNQAITNILKDFKVKPAPLSERWLPELDTLGLYLSGKKEQMSQYSMMLNVKGGGFPNEYDTPERRQEYRNYFLQKFNEYFHKQYNHEKECQRFLRKQIGELQKEIDICIKVARREQYGEEEETSLVSKLVRKFQKPLPDYDELIRRWNSTEDFGIRYNKLATNSEYRGLPCTEDMAVRLDISYRYKMFWYAIHYREAEFIRRLGFCEEEEQLTRESYTERLKRLSCVMPVFISTFHSLPKYMVCTDEGKKNMPLYDCIDLMIVDESGQVSPELAIPSFSLAKKAILVGDIEQIEPVWSISDEYSYINLKRFQVISGDHDKNYTFLRENGFLSSSGSIMKMARKSCNYQVGNNRGAFLTEHRRCLDTIIAYCNDYVYHGRLIPKKGNEVKYKDLPPKGYVHVNGISEPGKTGSRLNPAEASAIVAWLETEKDNLEAIYKKPIAQLVAIVTPFKAQENEIRNRAKDAENRDAYKEMTIGTVHSLQGAQCPIVIFSTVNSPGDSSYFMENGGKYNMINVAISRAQHHFIVFGNMNIFHPELNTPVGNMAKWLFDDPGNEISGNFIYQQEKPLAVYHPAKRLSTLDMHTGILSDSFQNVKQRLLIVSPFISIRAIEHDGLLHKIEQATDRGVEVLIYTDSRLDYDPQKHHLRSESEAGRKALVESGAKLRSLNGIHNKSLVIDDHTLVEGSFNWLSASREEKYSRHECSILLSAPEASKHIVNLIKELDGISMESESYQAKPCRQKMSITTGLTLSEEDIFNDWTAIELAEIKRRAQALGVKKQNGLSEQTLNIRKRYPRYYESWSKEEEDIILELLEKTNDLFIFCECLQRTPKSIEMRIDKMCNEFGSN